MKFLLTLSALSFIFSQSTFPEYGYLFDGFDDQLSFAVSNSADDFPSFSVQLWFRNEPKDKFGNLEQCIVSQGSWEERFKLSWTELSTLLITLRNSAGGLVDCHTQTKLSHSRWYNFAFTYESDSTPHATLRAYVNGVKIPLTCTNDKDQIYIGLIDSGKPFNGPLHGSLQPFTIAVCREGETGYQKCLFHGYIAGLRIYTVPLSKEHIRDVILHWDPTDISHPTPIVTQPFILTVKGSPRKIDHEVAHAIGSSHYHVHGHPEVKDMNLGDTQLSLLLTVANTKLEIMSSLESSISSSSSLLSEAVGQNQTNNFTSNSTIISVTSPLLVSEAVLQNLFQQRLGLLASLVGDDKVKEKLSNLRLVAILNRYVQVAQEEKLLWRSYNEYSIRMEMLGHTLAMMTRGYDVNSPRATTSTTTKSNGTESSNVDNSDKKSSDTTSSSSTNSANASSGENKRQLVAVIVPATSKGTQPDDLAGLPLMRSLLPSLYRTMSRDFDYRVYLAVNSGDSVYSNEKVVSALFDTAFVHWGDQKHRISHRIVLVPNTVIPKRALSALFNLPTLVANADGADFYYVVNDDLMMTSLGWTETFVSKIMNNPVLSGLGVAGGADTSDSITPQIEFPFFHKTHVEIFRWCGTNPWTFRNWWEDNWLTDIYLPFSSVFYLDSVTVKNYAGLDQSADKAGSADPRYEVTEGRRTPSYYRTEVESARRAILKYLKKGQSVSPIEDMSMDYCSMSKDNQLPTLAVMPVAPNEDVLDPCNTNPGHVGGRLYQTPVHEVEVPHVAYVEILSGIETAIAEKKVEIKNDISYCNRGMEDMDWSWRLCQHALGMDLLPAYLQLPLLRGELCKPPNPGDSISFASCTLLRPLRILIIHNHCPLFTRYGSDKRLYHIAETLVGLGHLVAFGGMQVSGLESSDDHKRLDALGVKLYSPLTEPLANDTSHLIPLKDKYSKVLLEVDPDLVIMTLWFWNVSPAPEVFLPITRQLAPMTRIAVLSDDAHAERQLRILKQREREAEIERERALLEVKNDPGILDTGVKMIQDLLKRRRSGASSESESKEEVPSRRNQDESNSILAGIKNIVADSISAKLRDDEIQNQIFQAQQMVNSLRHREYMIFSDADVVLTITDEDRNSLLEGHPEPTPGSKSLVLIPERVHTIRYGLSPSEMPPGRRWNSDSKLDQLRQSRDAHRGRGGLVFVGNGANPTNKVALDWFFKEILPDVKSRIKEVEVTIIGADWDYVKEEYSYLNVSIVIKGLLSQEEMGWHLLRARVFISPMIASTGLNTKNVLALSRGIPLVTTPSGADGLRLEEGELLNARKNPNDIEPSYSPPCLIASDPANFSEAIYRLYTDVVLWMGVSSAATNHARKVFSLQAQAQDLEAAINIAFIEKKKTK